VAAEKTPFALDEIYINGGKRGFIIKINPRVLEDMFDLTQVDVAI
jgi:prolyl-tRNA editing enzyme YbaK/EbsC (Cys-tRNA(Pro) deacylase)